MEELQQSKFPNQGAIMAEQQAGAPAWCKKAASIRGQYKVPGCNYEQTFKTCINTKFGSICHNEDEDAKTCISTKFGSVCTNKFREEEMKTCVKTKFGSICTDKFSEEDAKTCISTKFGGVCMHEDQELSWDPSRKIMNILGEITKMGLAIAKDAKDHH